MREKAWETDGCVFKHTILCKPGLGASPPFPLSNWQKEQEVPDVAGGEVALSLVTAKESFRVYAFIYFLSLPPQAAELRLPQREA